MRRIAPWLAIAAGVVLVVASVRLLDVRPHLRGRDDPRPLHLPDRRGQPAALPRRGRADPRRKRAARRRRRSPAHRRRRRRLGARASTPRPPPWPQRSRTCPRPGSSRSGTRSSSMRSRASSEPCTTSRRPRCRSPPCRTCSSRRACSSIALGAAALRTGSRGPLWGLLALGVALALGPVALGGIGNASDAEDVKDFAQNGLTDAGRRRGAGRFDDARRARGRDRVEPRSPSSPRPRARPTPSWTPASPPTTRRRPSSSPSGTRSARASRSSPTRSARASRASSRPRSCRSPSRCGS